MSDLDELDYTEDAEQYSTGSLSPTYDEQYSTKSLSPTYDEQFSTKSLSPTYDDQPSTEEDECEQNENKKEKDDHHSKRRKITEFKKQMPMKNENHNDENKEVYRNQKQTSKTLFSNLANENTLFSKVANGRTQSFTRQKEVVTRQKVMKNLAALEERHKLPGCSKSLLKQNLMKHCK